MSELIKDNEIISFSWNLLARIATDQNAFQAGLKAFAQDNPAGFQTISAALKAAGLETTSTEPPPCALQAKDFCAPKIGHLYEGKGVFVGDWQITPTVIAPLYVAPDLERDEEGNQIQLTFNRQKEGFAKRNSGRIYGNGCVAAIAKAIVDRTYQEGDCFHGPLEFMNGRDVYGNEVRKVNVFSLLKAGNPAFAERLLKEIKNGNSCWAFSGTEHPGTTSRVYDASLRGGDGHWVSKDDDSSGALRFSAFGVMPLTL
ncbi:MAG: hypothetical protein AB7S81_03655 [Bdellovibrionales bacterium]